MSEYEDFRYHGERKSSSIIASVCFINSLAIRTLTSVGFWWISIRLILPFRILASADLPSILLHKYIRNIPPFCRWVLSFFLLFFSHIFYFGRLLTNFPSVYALFAHRLSFAPFLATQTDMYQSDKLHDAYVIWCDVCIICFWDFQKKKKYGMHAHKPK